MDNQQNPVTPMSTPITAGMPEHKKIGPIVAILVIVLVLIIGAIYLFASNINQNSGANSSTSLQTPSQTQTQQVPAMRNDDVSSLQTDLNASTNGVSNDSF